MAVPDSVLDHAREQQQHQLIGITESDLRRVSSGDYVPEDLRSKVSAFFPGLDIDYTSCAPTTGHSSLRAIRSLFVDWFKRRYGLDRACDLPPGYDVLVKDIGANPMHMLKRGVLQCHNCCPRLGIRDAARHVNNIENIMINKDKYPQPITEHAQRILDMDPQFICTAKSENCRVKARYCFFGHSNYDMTLEQIAKIMYNSSAKLASGIMIFDPIVLVAKEGRIDCIKAHFKRFDQGGREYITFFFDGDCQETYTHLYSTYLALVQGFTVEYRNVSYVISADRYDVGHLVFNITEVKGSFPGGKVSRIFRLQGDDRVVIRSYALKPLPTNKDNIMEVSIVVPRELWDRTVAYGLQVTEGKFRFKTILGAAIAFNQRIVVKGTTIRAADSIPIELLIPFAIAVYLFIYDESYASTRVISAYTDEQDRARVAAHLPAEELFDFTWKTIFTHFAPSVLLPVARSIVAESKFVGADGALHTIIDKLCDVIKVIIGGPKMSVATQPVVNFVIIEEEVCTKIDEELADLRGVTLKRSAAPIGPEPSLDEFEQCNAYCCESEDLEPVDVEGGGHCFYNSVIMSGATGHTVDFLRGVCARSTLIRNNLRLSAAAGIGVAKAGRDAWGEAGHVLAIVAELGVAICVHVTTTAGYCIVVRPRGYRGVVYHIAYVGDHWKALIRCRPKKYVRMYDGDGHLVPFHAPSSDVRIGDFRLTQTVFDNKAAATGAIRHVNASTTGRGQIWMAELIAKRHITEIPDVVFEAGVAPGSIANLLLENGTRRYYGIRSPTYTVNADVLARTNFDDLSLMCSDITNAVERDQLVKYINRNCNRSVDMVIGDVTPVEPSSVNYVLNPGGKDHAEVVSRAKIAEIEVARGLLGASGVFVQMLYQPFHLRTLDVVKALHQAFCEVTLVLLDSSRVMSFEFVAVCRRRRNEARQVAIDEEFARTYTEFLRIYYARRDNDLAYLKGGNPTPINADLVAEIERIISCSTLGGDSGSSVDTEDGSTSTDLAPVEPPRTVVQRRLRLGSLTSLFVSCGSFALSYFISKIARNEYWIDRGLVSLWVLRENSFIPRFITANINCRVCVTESGWTVVNFQKGIIQRGCDFFSTLFAEYIGDDFSKKSVRTAMKAAAKGLRGNYTIIDPRWMYRQSAAEKIGWTTTEKRLSLNAKVVCAFASFVGCYALYRFLRGCRIDVEHLNTNQITRWTRVKNFCVGFAQAVVRTARVAAETPANTVARVEQVAADSVTTTPDTPYQPDKCLTEFKAYTDLETAHLKDSCAELWKLYSEAPLDVFKAHAKHPGMVKDGLIWEVSPDSNITDYLAKFDGVDIVAMRVTTGVTCLVHDGLQFAHCYWISAALAKVDITAGNHVTYSMTNGVPGCGKSTMVKELIKTLEKQKNAEGAYKKVVVVTKTKSMKLELIEKKGVTCEVRTFASVLRIDNFNKNRKHDVMIVDEAGMNHPGEIVAAAILFGVKEVFAFGDVLQIAWINKLGVHVKYHKARVLFSIDSAADISYRCPASVCARLSGLYEDANEKAGLGRIGMRSKNQSAGLDETCFSSRITGVDQVDIVADTRYLTFTQGEKDAVARHLRDGGGDVNNLSTVHEFQGGTARDVIVVRLSAANNDLYTDVRYSIVALTRHTHKMTYCCIAGPTDDRLLQLVDTKPTDAQLQAAFVSTGGDRYIGYRDRADDGFISDRKAPRNVKVVTVNSAKIRETAKWVRDHHVGKAVQFDLRNVHTPGQQLETVQTIYRSLKDRDVDLYYKNILKGDYLPDELRQCLEVNQVNDMPLKRSESEAIETFRVARVTLPVPEDVCLGDVQVMVSGMFDDGGVIDTSLDTYQVHTSPIAVEGDNFKMPRDFSLPLPASDFDCLVPTLQLPVTAARPITGVESLIAAAKRNFLAIYSTTDISARLQARQMVGRLFTHIIDPSKFSPDKPRLTSAGLLDWIAKQEPHVLKMIDADVGALETAMDEYAFAIKRVAKPQLKCDASSHYAALQTILAQDKNINAFLSPIFANMKQQLMAALRPGFIIFSDDTVENLAARMDVEIPLCEVASYHVMEVDMAKFDKSQSDVALHFECELMRALGVSDQLIEVWELTHIFSRAYDYATGLGFNVNYQRRSGDPSTYLFNTFFVAGIAADVFDRNPPKKAVFSGDDCTFWFDGAPVYDYDSFQYCYNVEAKIINFDGSVYFCSRFLLDVCGSWVCAPDPIKAAMKMARRDLKNEIHREQFRISYMDSLAVYDDWLVCLAVEDATLFRYGVRGAARAAAAMCKATRDAESFMAFFPDDPTLRLNRFVKDFIRFD